MTRPTLPALIERTRLARFVGLNRSDAMPKSATDRQERINEVADELEREEFIRAFEDGMKAARCGRGRECNWYDHDAILFARFDLGFCSEREVMALEPISDRPWPNDDPYAQQ